ncbi:MAG: hypothetical protein JWP65_27 [Ramlibacter sp.]|jgi:hypothetical protein|uniref:hypothetical protein n=1 Tax=Ramlibacter sp. TaxID=1917967 RepID=UPI002630C0FD|nr:hypothetical protein [Ramlibacter sp.]MDB5749606.1 hypothetical protein [Ramlibacter sp.]
MKTLWPLLGAALLLAGCLEVEQHPAWRHGAYDGKPDDLQHQRLFHGDRMAWMAAIINRNWRQDEYRRTFHKGGRP